MKRLKLFGIIICLIIVLSGCRNGMTSEQKNAYKNAKYYKENNDYKKIVEELEPMVQDGCKAEELYEMLGDSYIELGEYSKALDILNREKKRQEAII